MKAAGKVLRTSHPLNGSSKAITGVRKAVIEVLEWMDGQGLTLSGLMRITAAVHDRKTLHRAAEWLVRAGLAVRATDAGGKTVYFLATREPSAYAVFECRRCARLWRSELPSGAFESWQIVSGAVVHRKVLRALGWCADCVLSRGA